MVLIFGGFVSIAEDEGRNSVIALSMVDARR